jgi:PASTA domain-containing protein
MRTKTVPAVILSLACALAGCSGTSDGNTATATAAATTVIATVDATTPAPARPTPTKTVEPIAAATTATTRVAPAKVKVPNGVGLDYQSAQDLWRAAGLHVAPAVDATGAHRLPVMDSNWVVVSQDLKVGTKVAADSFITATVKKYSDS